MAKEDYSKVTYLQVLKNKYFLVYNMTTFLSIFGSTLTSIALILLAFGDIGSILNVSYYRIASMVPVLLLGLVAGVYVDRFGKKRSYLYSSLAGAVVILIPIFWKDLYTIVLVALLLSTFGLFKSSSHEAILPMILKKKEIKTANSVTRMVTSGGAIIAPILSVFFINWYGFALIFLIDSITSVLDAVCIYFIPIEENQKGESSDATVIADIKASLKHLRERKTVIFLFSSGFMITLIGSGLGLYILEYNDLLFSTRIPYGYYRSAGYAGSFIGGFVTGKFFQRMSYRYLMTLSCVLFGLSIIGLYLFPFVFSFVLFGITFGMGNAVAGISTEAGIQELCEQEYLGRVSSFSHIVLQGAGILAVILAVLMLNLFSTSNTMLIAGSTLLVISIFLMILTVKNRK